MALSDAGWGSHEWGPFPCHWNKLAPYECFGVFVKIRPIVRFSFVG